MKEQHPQEPYVQIKIYLVLLAVMLASANSFGHESLATKADIAIDEKLGQYLPPDAVFLDENGNKTNIKKYIDKPTIIAPVYLGCAHECPLLLSGLAQAL